METTMASGERIVEAGMAIDELISKYGIRVVLAGLASAAEIRGEDAWERWQGLEGLFDPCGSGSLRSSITSRGAGTSP